MNSLLAEKYRQLVLARIAKGRAISKPVKKTALKKGTPAKRAAGASTSSLCGKTMVKKSGANDTFELEQELAKMLKEGVLACTNGIWWTRAAR